MSEDSAVEAIVRSVISLLHTLGLRSTAESDGQPQQLDAFCCDASQRYLDSSAVANGVVPSLLDKGPIPSTAALRRLVDRRLEPESRRLCRLGSRRGWCPCCGGPSSPAAPRARRPRRRASARRCGEGR